MLSWTLASDSSLTVVTNNFETLTTTNSNPNWDKILAALRGDRGDEVIRLMSIKDAMVDYFDGNLAIKGNTVWYGNQTLHGRDVERTLELMRMAVPVGPMVKFLNAKMRNPSRRAVDELYNFLTNPAVDKNGGMPITPNGTILGYKGVRADYYSINGNPETVVLQGKVDGGGHILNEVGATIEVARNSVCDDYRVGCGAGVHIGSREYAEGWAGTDGKVLLVEFSPEDVVSVPEDCNYQKLRACKYIVRGECQRETKLNTTYTEDYTLQSVWDGDPDVFDKDIEDEGDSENDPEETDSDCLDSDYDTGYESGKSDGKAHRARMYKNPSCVTSPNVTRFVEGYCDGYQDERSRQRDALREKPKIKT